MLSPQKTDLLTHFFASEDIRQPTEQQLTTQSANWGSNFDAKILLLVELLVYENG